jgi:hypothetical protein
MWPFVLLSLVHLAWVSRSVAFVLPSAVTELSAPTTDEEDIPVRVDRERVSRRVAEGFHDFGCGDIDPATLGTTPSARFKNMLTVCGSAPPSLKTESVLIDPDGVPIYSMTKRACALYVLSGASILEGKIAEFGTFAGASTHCIAAGANYTGLTHRVYGVDLFKAGFASVNRQKLELGLQGTRWIPEGGMTDDYDMLPYFNFHMKAVYPSIATVKMFIEPEKEECRSKFARSLGDRPLDVWTTDSAKGWHNLRSQLDMVKEHLHIGSIVILADFFYAHSGTDQLILTYEYLVGKSLRLIATIDHMSHAWFEVTDDIQLPEILTLEREQQKGGDHWKEVKGRVQEDIRRVGVFHDQAHGFHSESNAEGLLTYRLADLDVSFNGWV